MYIRGGEKGPETGGKKGPVASHETRFGRTYGEVLHDKELSLAAKAVYAELAYWAISTDRPARGMRKIAEDLGADRKTVRAALEELELRGHIKILSSGKQRGRYLMTNPMFRGLSLLRLAARSWNTTGRMGCPIPARLSADPKKNGLDSVLQ